MNTKMWNKKSGYIVEVFQIHPNGTATVWSDECAKKMHYNTGWEVVKMSVLVPLDFYKIHKDCYISEKDRKEMKKRLVYNSSTWTTSDNLVFTDCDKAIIHERSLVNGN